MCIALLFTVVVARAEPPAHLTYVNVQTGECGVHITGNTESRTSASVRRVVDPTFVPFQMPVKDDRCAQLLGRTPEHTNDVIAGACTELRNALSGNAEHDCKVLGYEYVGLLPVEETQCYPTVGMLLGSACPPELWFRLVAVCVLSVGLGVLFIGWNRARRRSRMLKEVE